MLFSSAAVLLALVGSVVGVPLEQAEEGISQRHDAGALDHEMALWDDMVFNRRAFKRSLIDKRAILKRDNSQALQMCLTSKNVPAVFPNSPNYAQLKQPFNLRLQYNPAVIIESASSQDVSNALQCASNNSIKVQAKGGGHSYASFSTGGQDGSMIIDMQKFQTITVDGSGLATVGAGVRLGNLASQLYKQAKRAMPHGTCPGVGIGGHATHGGFGYTSRNWGLSLDHIQAMDAVLANGTAVHVDQQSNPDLWYALRGDASDFAIITTFYMATVPAPDSIVNWQYNFGNMFSDPSKTAAVFSHIQDFATNAKLVDRKLGLGVYLDGSTFYVSGQYFGDLNTFQSKLLPELLRGLPTPIWTNTHQMAWLDSLVGLANGEQLEQPLTGYSAHDDFYAKSVVTPSSQPLTPAALQSYFSYINAHGIMPSNSATKWFSIMNLYGGPDSQINAVDPASSAYSDRSALWVVQHYGYTGDTSHPFPTTTMDFIDGLNTALTSQMQGTQFSAYQNYVDSQLTPQQAHQDYYGDAAYQKLVGIKQAYDPRGVFWNPQSVGN